MTRRPKTSTTSAAIANILQMLKLPDGTVKVLVEGSQRARIHDIVDLKTHFAVGIEPLPADNATDHETEAMRRTMIQQFDQYVKLNKKIPPEILTLARRVSTRPGRLADTIAAHLPLKLEQKQEVLEMFEVKKRLEHLLKLVEGELDILQVEKRIRGRVKRQMEKSQREYYLNEQVKAIQKELGEMEEGADLDEIEKNIKQARMPKEARKKAEAELKKLRLMSPMSAEATVVRNYIDALVSPAVAQEEQDQHRPRGGRENPRRGPLRPREGQGAHRRISRGAAARGQARRRRSCAWSARPAWARPRSASRSRARPTASSCACRSAACATKRRSAAIAAPTSARCPARSCRT